MRERVWVLLLAIGAFLLAGREGALGQLDAEEPSPKDYAYRDGKFIIGRDSN